MTTTALIHRIGQYGLGLLLLGGAARAQHTTIYDLPGQTAGDQFGEALNSAGDLNGDGFVDFLVASPQGAGGKGYVQAVSGRTGKTLYTLQGTSVGDAFGHAVAGLDDLDGDGAPEIIVGAPLAMGVAFGSGVAQVFSGATGALRWTFSGDSNGDHFGWSVASAGDVTGDGLGDIMVGAVDDDDKGNSSGSVRLFSGSIGAKLFTVTGDSGGQLFGAAIVGVGDWNNDQVPDFAVGAPLFTNTPFPGFVRVHSGKNGAMIRQIDGAFAADAFGSSIANLGDIEGDGVDDIVIGAPQPTGANRGYVELHLATGGPPIVQEFGDSPQDMFGAAVSAAGDIDEDGYIDIAVGAPGDDDLAPEAGSLRLLSSWTSKVISTTHGESPGLKLGSALSELPDMNEDDKSEVLISCMGDSSAAPNAGCARVLSTSPLRLAADAHLFSISGTNFTLLNIDFGTFFGGYDFLVLGSITGTSPGTPFGSIQVPLNRDRYFKFTRSNPNTSVLGNSGGVLSPSGTATAVFAPPANTLSVNYLGLTFHHAVVLFDANLQAIDVSNVVPVTLVL